MSHAAVSAPGKLILTGEHAAVYRRPALVTAIDLRMRAEVRERAEPGVVVDSPLLDRSEESDWATIRDETRRARRDWKTWIDAPSSRSWASPGRASLVRIALGEAALLAGGGDLPGLHVRIDSGLPIGSGFGSSAAAGLAVAGALLKFLGEAPDEDTLRRVSLEIERRQHGTPSGVDTEAVLRGGLLWCGREDDGTLRCEPVGIRSAHLLDGLRVYQSGNPAETTGEVVANVRRAREAAPERIEEAVETITEASRGIRGELAGEAGDPTRFVALIRGCEAALETLGVVPRAVRETIRRIEAEGGAAKISGAGAIHGDGAGSVLVYHPEAARIDTWDFLSRWEPLPVRLGAEGLRVEEAA
jgi:mevalonate kinase